MCLELRDCHKRLFWNLPPYGEPDLVIVRAGRGGADPVGSIPRQRGALVSGGVEERFSVHDYEGSISQRRGDVISEGVEERFSVCDYEGSIPWRRGALVSEGVEERFSVHDYEMGNGGSTGYFINQGEIILKDPPKAVGRGPRSRGRGPPKIDSAHVHLIASHSLDRIQDH